VKKVKFLTTFLVWILFSYAYTQNFQFLENINNKFTDIFFSLRGVEKPSKQILIVDIDEKSLTSMNGFNREKLAIIINNLTTANASIIGLDMTFPSEDKNSPKVVLTILGVDAQNVKDYDEILANSFKNSMLVSGYIFDFSSETIKGKVPNVSAILIQKGYTTREYLPEAKGIISNIDLLQKNSFSSGFFNLISDEDGVVRSTPLVVKYKDILYPSLSLEIVRTLWRKKRILIDYSKAGINSISLDNYVIPTDRFGRLIINFKGTSNSYKHISASKIYNNNFNKEQIKDKIVLIGASTSRFYDLRATPFDSTFSAIEIHANVIDNIINHDFLTKPNMIELLDIGILFVILTILYLFSMYGAIKNTIFSLVTMGSFFVIVFILFIKFGLILNIVFPFFASFVLYTILTSLQYINEVNLKNRLNKQLILEMQNRQDIIQEEVTQKTQELQKVVEEKTVLLRELHHRVKNNLQLILSISRLQQHELKDEKIDKEFGKLQNRIKSIAKTHEILCDNDDISNVNMSEYIGELCEEMESSFIQSNIDINIDVTATLPLRQAVYVGLVVNEIMSNSIKHAFGIDDGEIHIYLAKVKGEYILRISDNGVGYDKSDLKDSSLGLKLVKALVINQLDGSIKIQSDDWFGYLIKFKVSSE
jgi:adenylate cyclase